MGYVIFYIFFKGLLYCRALRLRGAEELCLDEFGNFHESFASLTNLSSLDVLVSWSGLHSFPDLPLLQSLDLEVAVQLGDDASLPASASAALRSLTSLKMTTCDEWQLQVSHHHKPLLIDQLL